MNTAQVDLQQLRIKHILFKSKVRSVLFGGVLDPIFFSAAGPIEQWFATVGFPKYNHITELLQLQRLHNALVQEATVLFTLYNAGKIDKAHEGLSDLEESSQKFLNTLNTLEKKLSL